LDKTVNNNVTAAKRIIDRVYQYLCLDHKMTILIKAVRAVQSTLCELWYYLLARQWQIVKSFVTSLEPGQQSDQAPHCWLL